MIKALEDVLKYKNDSVVERFCGLLEIQNEEAIDIFNECKKWLWVCANAANDRKSSQPTVPKKLAIDSSILIIDEMWHNFLCFTKDYNKFCDDYFGFFIHHSPTSGAYNAYLNKQSLIDEQYIMERKFKQYGYLYDILGEDIGRETIIKWYEVYADIYTSNKILSLRKK